jgi:perosamine synthetase
MPELCAAVALGQLERLEELVEARRQVARLYAQAVQGCAWLVPQSVPEGYAHSYWTYVLRLENGGAFSWYDFRNKFRELGGDGVYAAWQLTYLEPALRGKSFGPPDEPAQAYAPGLCPVAESVQPGLLQFKTNYLDMAVAERQANALAGTAAWFGR